MRRSFLHVAQVILLSVLALGRTMLRFAASDNIRRTIRRIIHVPSVG
jgi:hypothetical protein